MIPMRQRYLGVLLMLVCTLTQVISIKRSMQSKVSSSTMHGKYPFKAGVNAMKLKQFDTAADHFFDAMFMLHEGHTVDEVCELCYIGWLYLN